MFEEMQAEEPDTPGREGFSDAGMGKLPGRSVWTLAPVLAVAFANRNRWAAFLVGPAVFNTP